MNSNFAVVVGDFSVKYPDGREAVKNITLAVHENESVALLGSNGAGKSTLLLSLVGVVRGMGNISIAGTDLKDSTLSIIRRAAQLVFQDPNDQLFMPVLRDDIAFGPLNYGVDRQLIPELVDRCLDDVGLSGFGDRNPVNLSLGERKRASIAAVLACGPKVLLLDEPSAGLDCRGRRELVYLLNRLHAAKIIATHDLEFAYQTCSRGIVMADGRIVAEKPLDELYADERLLEESGLI